MLIELMYKEFKNELNITSENCLYLNRLLIFK